eukprot:gene5523-5509_t
MRLHITDVLQILTHVGSWMNFLDPRGALRLSQILCCALDAPVSADAPGRELTVPWGRCYALHGGRAYVLAPSSFPVPFTWTAPLEDHPMLAAAAVLDAWRRHNDSASGCCIFTSVASASDSDVSEGPRCMPAASTNALEVPHWFLLHDWAQACVQASRGQIRPPTSLISIQTAAHAGLLMQLPGTTGTNSGPNMMTRCLSPHKLKDLVQCTTCAVHIPTKPPCASTIAVLPLALPLPWAAQLSSTPIDQLLK